MEASDESAADLRYEQQFNFYTIGVIPDLHFRFVLARNSGVTREIAALQKATPRVEAMIGEAMLGAFFLSTHSAKGRNTVSLHLECKGPLHRIISFARSNGAIRATVSHPEADWEGAYESGKGPGILRVNRWDEDGQQTYSSAVEMRDISLDRNLEEYVGRSDQIQTFLRFQTSFGEDDRVNQIAGYMFQALPGAGPDEIDAVLDMIGERDPETLITALGAGADGVGGRTRPLPSDGGIQTVSLLATGAFHSYCDCSREKVETALYLMGRDSIQGLAEEDGAVEVFCEFCKKRYEFSRKVVERIFGDG